MKWAWLVLAAICGVAADVLIWLAEKLAVASANSKARAMREYLKRSRN